MRTPGNNRPRNPAPERAALATTLYSYGLDDLGDATVEYFDDPMGAWEAWAAEVRAIAEKRVPELAARRGSRAA